METLTIKKEKTCRDLYSEFVGKFSIAEVDNHPQLARLFTYLQHRCGRDYGNYTHTPDDTICELLVKFLGYDPRKQKWADARSTDPINTNMPAQS